MRNVLKMGFSASWPSWAIARPVHALSAYLTSFETTYPNAAGSRIDSCSLCHTAVPQLNSYGTAFATADHMFAPIEGLDSDGDGATNLAEIVAHSFPGDPSDTPPPAPTPTPTDTAPPPPTATATRTQPLASPSATSRRSTGTAASARPPATPVPEAPPRPVGPATCTGDCNGDGW